MKKVKKLVAFMLAAVMVLAMGMTAFAADNGSITINNATVGKDYAIYKVFDATYSGSNVAYTYTTTGDVDEDGAVNNDGLYTALIAAGSPFTLTATTTEKVYNVSTSSDAATISKWLTDNVNLLTKTDEKTEVNSETVAFTGLGYGYYYVTSSLGTAVTLTSAVPSVTVQDKNQKPGKPDEDGYKIIVDEKGNKVAKGESTVNYGDTISYVLRAKATNYDGDKMVAKYVAHDVLGAGLTGLKVTEVKVDNVAIANTAYTVKESTDLTDGCTTEIEIAWVKSTTVGDEITYTSIYDATSTIEIFCEATVTPNAVIGGTDSNLTNQGWFTWYDVENTNLNPNPDNDKTTVTSYTYAIGIYKTDEKGIALANAEFEISDAEGNKIPVKATSEAGVYEYDPTDYTAEGVTGEPNYTVVSPSSGKIIVKGVEAKKYTIHETKAPNGYNVMLDDETVMATALTSSTTTTTIYKDENGNITDTVTDNPVTVTFDVAAAAVNVVNKAGSTLPTTGGMGTTIFYILGGILVIGAAVLLVTRRRMRGME